MMLGSFYNVVGYRIPNNLSIVHPGSFCPKCNHKLKWYELIPIVSYVIQGGKCRVCKTKLSASYWVMELCTGSLFAVCYHINGFSLELLVSLIFVSSLMTIIISDIEYMIILDEVLLFANSCIYREQWKGISYQCEKDSTSSECCCSCLLPVRATGR